MRHVRKGICCAAAAGAIALGYLAAGVNAPAVAADPPCVAPADLVRLDLPLERTARHLASRKLTLIVALGSSSTAGSARILTLARPAPAGVVVPHCRAGLTVRLRFSPSRDRRL